MSRPYTHRDLDDGSFERTFDARERAEFVWHRDRADRTVTPLSGDGWMLQMDDCLPVLLERDRPYFIPKCTFHRLIAGDGILTVNIRES